LLQKIAAPHYQNSAPETKAGIKKVRRSRF
jgi:hypothetical protein